MVQGDANDEEGHIFSTRASHQQIYRELEDIVIIALVKFPGEK